MATGTKQRIFPLVLTPIEHFLLADDRPRYPMAFVIDMTFSGNLDRQAFDDALEQALDRHPLLKCFVRPAKRKELCWVASDGRRPYVDWAEQGEPIELPGSEWIDLRKETGLRIWIRQGVEQVQVVFQFQHVCCDGIGAYRFLGDLLAVYGTHTAGDESARPKLGTIDATRLRSRADGCGYLDRTGQPARQVKECLKLMTSIMGRGCDPLYPSRPKGANPEYPGYCSYTFSEEELKRLRDAARSSAGMLNDLLLLELFYTMDGWNQERRRIPAGGKYRIMMPVDLRDTRDFETPAANVIGYSFVAHKTPELQDRRRLGSSIREEVARIKQDCHGQKFVDMVSVGSRAGGIMPLLISLPRTLATVILSNIGDPSRRFQARFPRKGGRAICGNLTLERISGFPPIRCKTRAAFSIVTYRKELTIGLRCDPHLFSMQDTQAMLDIYVKQLRAHLET